MKVSDVMREVRNYFPRYRIDGHWRAEHGALVDCDMLLMGDWIAVSGSMRNNGVYQVAEDGAVPGLRDEQWDGTVWLLGPPEDFLTLCAQIDAWCEKHPEDDVKREQFGAYSVERAVDAQGVPMGWQHVFASALKPWRRMYTEVSV